MPRVCNQAVVDFLFDLYSVLHVAGSNLEAKEWLCPIPQSICKLSF